MKNVSSGNATIIDITRLEGYPQLAGEFMLVKMYTPRIRPPTLLLLLVELRHSYPRHFQRSIHHKP